MQDPASLKNRQLDELAGIVAELRQRGKKVVHCHGVFDLLHVGHIKHLTAARSHGDVLVVTVTPDHWVNKGPHRPAFAAAHRLEALAALSCVDYVALNRWPTAVETIGALRPDLFVKGRTREVGPRDHTNAIQLEEQAIEQVGGQLLLTEEETYSASTLINRHLALHEPAVRSFLDDFRSRFTAEQIVQSVKDLRGRRILLVGEAVLEEYQYCRATGQSRQDPVLSARLLRTEHHAGGVLAMANQLAGFCDRVAVLTCIGQNDPPAELVEQTLASSVRGHLLRRAAGRTAVTRRVVEQAAGVKLLELAQREDAPLRGADESGFVELLERLVPEHDTVVVADHGHGLLGAPAIEVLTRRAPFLALGPQPDPGCTSGRLASYPRADLLLMDESHARLETRQSRAEPALLAEALTEQIDCPRVMLTRGVDGITCKDSGSVPEAVPASGGPPVDQVGVDLALLALSAPCVAMGLPLVQVSFIASVVRAEAARIPGNSRPIEPATLLRHITSLMS